MADNNPLRGEYNNQILWEDSHLPFGEAQSLPRMNIQGSKLVVNQAGIFLDFYDNSRISE